MSDRKAVNKYYPPDWEPSKGSINTYVGQHPLRDRARKLDQGILIIRFEIPYNIWCLGCGKMIGTGTRYNAEKKKVGSYYTTPILSFRFKCHLCPTWIEMRTDPKNTRYEVIAGAKQKNETWDPEEVGAHHIQDPDTKTKLLNPLFRAEHEHNEKELGRRLKPVLVQLAEDKKVYRDTFLLDKKLRDRFRKQRHKIETAVDEKEGVRSRLNINVNVLAPSAEDEVGTKAEDFGTRLAIRDKQHKRARLKQSSILPQFETVKTKERRLAAASLFKAGRRQSPHVPAHSVTKTSGVAVTVHLKAKSDEPISRDSGDVVGQSCEAGAASVSVSTIGSAGGPAGSSSTTTWGVSETGTAVPGGMAAEGGVRRLRLDYGEASSEDEE